MTGKTHALGGLLFGAGASVAISANPVTAGTLMMASTVGALIPDIDHPSSIISRKIPILSWCYQGIALIDKGISKLFKKKYIAGHRGITHSIILYLFLAVLIAALCNNPQLFLLLEGIMLGAISHIVFDMFNPSGVPILLPFSWHKWRLVPKKIAIPTKNFTKKGAWKENLFAIVVLIIDAILVKIALGL